ncbi:hypothetical protein TIFTF001_045409 [Ficus carica]|uniref:Uncharacterized protein n=1 Tax=Ficus carica TaxID=3494 RepID=A0AA87YR73_FICCA|nr:hypothetical protein TIFTF001_045409 [Ficus carica]
MPCHSPLADESMMSQASHLVDDPRVLRKLKDLEEKIEKMNREFHNNQTWARGGSRGGDRVVSEGVGFENGRDVNVMASDNEDVVRDVRDSVDVGMENYEGVGVENSEGIGVENDRDIGFQNSGGGVIENCENGGDNLKNIEMNVLYYHSPISSNDCANGEDVSEVEQPER